MVLQGLGRSLRLQYAMRKDVIWVGGMLGFYATADHLILQRTEQKLRAVGLIHQGKLDDCFNNVSNSLKRV